MKKLIKKSKRLITSGVLAVLAVSSSAVHAITDADVTSSYAASEISVGLAITGCIALVALGVGLGMIISIMRKL